MTGRWGTHRQPRRRLRSVYIDLCEPAIPRVVSVGTYLCCSELSAHRVCRETEPGIQTNRCSWYKALAAVCLSSMDPLCGGFPSDKRAVTVVRSHGRSGRRVSALPVRACVREAVDQSLSLSRLPTRHGAPHQRSAFWLALDRPTTSVFRRALFHLQPALAIGRTGKKASLFPTPSLYREARVRWAGAL